jgi:DNA/RNA endonuclease G (NUC1)
MLIKSALITASEQRFKQANFSPVELDKKLGDGPMQMTVQQKQRRRRQLLAESDDAQAAQIGLERIISGNDLDSINYLLKGTYASHSVCRIQLKDARSNLIGYASGFLIGPGVMMTNHHVFGGPSDATNSIADFDYELDINGTERAPVRFGFEPGRLFYTNDRLDYSIVAVAPASLDGGRKLSDWGWLPLSGEPGKGDPGEYLTIIQHPGGQTKQVCVRENNPFDRGHLVRRLDATWGSTVDEAKQHGDDSFHFTNCSPQFFSFNQGAQLWAGLEDFTRDIVLQNKDKGIVMNGPIFDGPDAKDAELPDPSAPKHKDPTFGGVSIPKYFWKILITKRSGNLTAAAFIVSQRNLIMGIDRIQEAEILEKLSTAQVRLFQVSIANLTKLTKLDFGNLGEADAHEATSVGLRLIESYDDIRWGE